MAKIVFDRIFALLALFLLAPFFLIISLLTLFLNGWPFFFCQLRPGLSGKQFMMYKFRTMSDKKDELGVLFPDEQRLTRFGMFLRSTSLDELPELLNVLKGEMSIVGPRPLLVEYLDLYTHEQARRHDVKPGITGWAQINGRNTISWEEKFELDVWYVDNQSFLLDIKIFFLTIIKIVQRKDISYEGQATMTPFTGSREKDEK